MIKNNLTRLLSVNSDKYGFPHMIQVLHQFNAVGFINLTEQQLIQYVIENMDQLKKIPTF